MDISANLGLPYLAPAQAQKHVTVNEALRLLDALVQIAVESRAAGTPPPNPAEGLRYIVAPGAGGAWTGQDDALAVWHEGAWLFLSPRAGWLAWVADEGAQVVWSGGAWAEPAPQVTGAALFGVNTAADTVNRLAVKSDAVLLSHDDATPGTGDARLVMNKAGSGNTGAVLFQSNWSGRAEFGLTGDDDWHVKVSADGGSWTEALVADGASGVVAFGAAARLPGFAVTALPDAGTAGAGALIYVTDETGGPVPAFSDGSAWRRVTDRAVIA